MLRERFGCDEESVDWSELPDEPTVEDVWRYLVERHPSLEDERSSIRLALNQYFAELDAPVEPGDEIALIPPVSGGSGERIDETGRLAITSRALDAESIVDRVRRDDAGAVVSFQGTVRDHTDTREVETLVYETYLEMALKKIVDIAEDVGERWPEVQLAAHHRYGRLNVGEVAVVVAASSPHRPPAFEATRHVIERIKEVVPIWKKEIGPDGEEWIGGCHAD